MKYITKLKEEWRIGERKSRERETSQKVSGDVGSSTCLSPDEVGL